MSLHRDRNNIGDSAIFAVGDFDGGELYVEGNGVLDLQISKDAIIIPFDAWHGTLGFTGRRYSIVAYTANELKTLPATCKVRGDLQRAGFSLPACMMGKSQKQVGTHTNAARKAEIRSELKRIQQSVPFADEHAAGLHFRLVEGSRNFQNDRPHVLILFSALKRQPGSCLSKDEEAYLRLVKRKMDLLKHGYVVVESMETLSNLKKQVRDYEASNHLHGNVCWASSPHLPDIEAWRGKHDALMRHEC